MTPPAYRRARRTFWALVVLAILLIGGIGALLAAPTGPVTGLAMAGLGVLAAVAIALATRLLLALTGRLVPKRNRPPARR